MSIKRLVIGVFIIIPAVVLAVLIFTKDRRFNLSVEDNGEKKFFSVRSNIDGDLGTFIGGGYGIKLSEGKHLITLKTAGHSNEYYSVEAKNNNDSLLLVNFTKSNETVKLIPKLENEYKNSRIISCGYFSEKTWIHCGMSYGQLILKKEGDNWILKAIEEYISDETLTKLNVPEDLLIYAKDN